MFSYLFDTAFPALGRFFGMLAGVAQTKFGDLLMFVFPSADFHYSIPYVNVFTGSSDIITPWIPSYGSSLGLNIIITIRNLLNDSVGLLLQLWSDFTGISYMQTWLAMLILFAHFFFAFVFIRFLINLIKR